MTIIAEHPIPIIFASTASAGRADPVGRPALMIVPDQNSWNDFGYRLYAKFYVLLGGHENQSTIRLMFEGQAKTADYLVALFAAHGPVIAIADIPRQMCSLQQSVDSYRELVVVLGFERAITALRALGDAVVLDLENDDPARQALIHSEPFHAGMIRNSEVYRAYRRGLQHLRPEPAAEVIDSAMSFSLRPELPSGLALNPLVLDFAPDPMFDDRASVLIGRNGVGKTQSLLALINGLTTGANPEEQAAVQLTPLPAVRRVLMFSSVPSDPYPKAILPWLGIDYEYHAVAIDAAPLGRTFMLSLIDCIRDDGTMFGEDKSRRARERLLVDTLTDLGLWEGLHLPLTQPPQGKEDQFPAIRQIDNVPYFPIYSVGGEYRTITFANRIDWSKPAVVFDTFGRQRHLSSGELAMLQFSAQAIASIEQGSLLLFDEPETHLHPNYVSQFMDLLQELLKRTRSVAIIATHSAYVVREVPRQRVSIFMQQHEGLSIVRPRIQTFGANTEALSQYIFGDSLISHRYQRVLRAWARVQGRELGLEGVIERFGEELNPETLSFIARVIDEQDG